MKTIRITTESGRHHQANLTTIETGDEPLMFKLDGFKLLGTDQNPVGDDANIEVIFTSCRVITKLKLDSDIFPEDLGGIIAPLIDKAFDQAEEDHFPAR